MQKIIPCLILALLAAGCGVAPEETEPVKWAQVAYSVTAGSSSSLDSSFLSKRERFRNESDGKPTLVAWEGENGSGTQVEVFFASSPADGDSYAFSSGGQLADIRMLIRPDAECMVACDEWTASGGAATVKVSGENVTLTFENVTLQLRPGSNFGVTVPEETESVTIRGGAEWTRACETGGSCDGEKL